MQIGCESIKSECFARRFSSNIIFGCSILEQLNSIIKTNCNKVAVYLRPILGVGDILVGVYDGNVSKVVRANQHNHSVTDYEDAILYPVYSQDDAIADVSNIRIIVDGVSDIQRLLL